MQPRNVLAHPLRSACGRFEISKPDLSRPSLNARKIRHKEIPSQIRWHYGGQVSPSKDGLGQRELTTGIRTSRRLRRLKKSLCLSHL